MGWLRKLFKGPSHKILERQFYRRHDDVIGNEPSCSGVLVEHENEDIDHAFALCVGDDDRKGKRVIDARIQLKEDEQLARAIEESLIVGTNQNVNECENGNMHQPFRFPYSEGYRICAGCLTDIGQGGRFLSCLGVIWHPECFRCTGCKYQISDYEFSLSGSNPFHKSCYKEYHHPKCEVCGHFIPTNAAGLIEYRAHPFWVQRYCPSHEQDGTPRCCSCERMESKDMTYADLNDGRKLCLECLDTAVMDLGECHPLSTNIHEFYESLSMEIKQNIPLVLVERQALNEALEGENNSHYHMPETRGLCLSEERTSNIISRSREKTPQIGDSAVGTMTEPHNSRRRCDVTAILVLYGLPRLLTGSILVHEMMHAWLRLKGYKTLNEQVEEGICQVMSHMWLSSQLDGGAVQGTSLDSFQRRIGELFRHQIESDLSPVYGEGFRAAKWSVFRYGLPATLHHISLTGVFPS